MRRLTASVAGRAVACPASLVLPGADRPVGEAALWGRMVDDYLSAGATPEALASVPDPELRAKLAVIPVDELPIGPGFERQVSLAMDLATGQARRLPATEHGASGEVTARADVMAVLDDGTIYVGEYKTGRAVLPPAAEHAQLGVTVLLAVRAAGAQRGRGDIIHLEDDRARGDRAEFGPMELDAIHQGLVVAQARAHKANATLKAGGMPDVAMGEHCRYCPAATTSCPAVSDVVTALARQSEAAPTLSEPRRAYEFFRLAEQALALYKQALCVYADHEPIDLGGGRVFGSVEESREYLVPSIAHAVLVDACGAEVADSAVSWDISKASIRRALAQLPRGEGSASISEMEDGLLEELRRRGGVTRKTFFQVKEHKTR